MNFSTYLSMVVVASEVLRSSKPPSCALCSGRGSVKHILSSCLKALADGHYRWLHDQILKAVVDSSIGYNNQQATPPKNDKLCQGWMGNTSHSQDQRQAENFSGQAAALSRARCLNNTASRHGKVFSNSIKQLIMMKLTVAWECLEKAQEWKCTKCQVL